MDEDAFAFVLRELESGESIPDQFIDRTPGFHIWEIGSIGGTSAPIQIRPTHCYVKKLADLGKIPYVVGSSESQRGVSIESTTANVLVSRGGKYFLWAVSAQLPDLVLTAPEGCLSDLELAEEASSALVDHPHLAKCLRCAWRCAILREPIAAAAHDIDLDAPPFTGS